MKTLESRTAIWRLWKINSSRHIVEGKEKLKDNQFSCTFSTVFNAPKLWTQRKSKSWNSRAWMKRKMQEQVFSTWLGSINEGVRAATQGTKGKSPGFFFFLFTFFFQLHPPDKLISLLAAFTEERLKSLRERNPFDQKNTSLRSMI